MATYTWGNSGGGNFGSGVAWLPSGQHPQAGDTADITSAFSGADYSVQVTDGEAAALVNIGVANAALIVEAGGILQVGSIDLTNGTLEVVSEGEITGDTTITDGSGTTVIFNDGTLDGVTWKGTLGLTGVQTSSTLTITTSLSVLNAAGNGPGVIDITGPGASLNFDSSMTLNSASGGNLVINIGTSSQQAQYLSIGSNTVLTFGTAVSLNQVAAGSTIYLGDIGGNSGGTIVNDGTISLTSGTGSSAFFNPSNFVNNGTIIDVGGGLPAAAGEDLELTPLTSFEDGQHGIINISDYGKVHIQGPNGSVDVSGTISLSTNSTLDLDTAATVTDTLGSAGVIQVSTGSTAEIDYNYTGTVSFLDATGVLALGQEGGAYTGSVTGLSRLNPGTHDNIDLLLTSSVTNLDPVFTSPTGGVLNVMDNTTTLAAINLVGNYIGDLFTFGSDGQSTPGTDIWLGCFLAGSAILTERGEVAVKSLREGDYAVTLTGKGAVCKPIRWIGHSRIDLDRHPTPQTVTPIRILAGAFGEDLPRRDLLLSPDHAVHVDGALIPVHHLVNGATIRREAIGGTVMSYHVELDAHDVLVANGLPAESYLDTGNRADFENGGGVRNLHPEFRAAAWSERACAPQVTEGAALEAVRARLAQRLEAMGFVATDDPALIVAADGGAVPVERVGAHGYRCRLPADARVLRIASRSFIPDEGNPAAGDARRLGVPIAALRIDGVALALDDLVLEGGLHPPEAGWRWTDGAATLRLDRPASRLEIDLLPMPCPYWAAPVDTADADAERWVRRA